MPKVEPAESQRYVYVASESFRLGLRPRREEERQSPSGRKYIEHTPPIRCRFEFGRFELTEDFAKKVGEPIEHIVELLRAHPNFGKTFREIEAPDKKASKADLAYAEQSAAIHEGKTTSVTQGARTTAALATKKK